jgi:flagellar hook-basal body complex protein FliE
METRALDQVLTQLRAAAARAGLNGEGVAAAGAAPAARPPDFAAVLKASLEHVNTRQQQAVQLARDFELGAPGANLPEVMVSMQKASVAFQQTVQVRNRLVSAYHDIMNMQV